MAMTTKHPKSIIKPPRRPRVPPPYKGGGRGRDLKKFHPLLNSATLALINTLLGQVGKGGSYIWKTMEDERVRKSHAARHGAVFEWKDDPKPGSEPHCRCWAETLVHTIGTDIEREELSPLPLEVPKIPGTNIRDRGISEKEFDRLEREAREAYWERRGNEAVELKHYDPPSPEGDQLMVIPYGNAYDYQRERSKFHLKDT